MVRLDRYFSSERINEIVNHPTIFPSVCGHHTEPMDLTNVTANKDNVCLVGEHGCVLFIKHQPGVYEFHTSVLPEGRGEWMVGGSKEAFRYLFLNTDAFELMTKCPDGNVAAKAGARIVGCQFRFKTRALWPSDVGLVAIDVYSIILQEWAKNADNLIESGKWFHETLESEYIRLDKSLTVHEEDEVHDRYVGATIEMIKGGQFTKAVAFYNRWAIMSGYKKISVISTTPLIFDIDDCKIQVEQNNFRVV